MPDGGGEGEESLEDAGGYSGGFAAAVSFEIELGFESLVDRFDDLAEGSKKLLEGTGLFAFESRADQGDPCFGESGLEPSGSVALVSDQGLAGPVKVGVDRDHLGCNISFVFFGSGERKRHRQS